MTGMKHDHRKSKLGFPFDLIPCEEKKKKRIPNFIISQKKDLPLHYILDLYIYTLMGPTIQ